MMSGKLMQTQHGVPYFGFLALVGAALTLYFTFVKKEVSGTMATIKNMVLPILISILLLAIVFDGNQTAQKVVEPVTYSKTSTVSYSATPVSNTLS